MQIERRRKSACSVEADTDRVDSSDHNHTDSGDLFKLSSSGRYVHTKSYIVGNLAKSNISMDDYTIADVVLRKNRGVDVHGFLVSIRIGDDRG